MCANILPVFLFRLVKPKDRYQPTFFFVGGIFQKRERNAAGPIAMFHEVATLVHPIETSKRTARP